MGVGTSLCSSCWTVSRLLVWGLRKGRLRTQVTEGQGDPHNHLLVIQEGDFVYEIKNILSKPMQAVAADYLARCWLMTTAPAAQAGKQPKQLQSCRTCTADVSDILPNSSLSSIRQSAASPGRNHQPWAARAWAVYTKPPSCIAGKWLRQTAFPPVRPIKLPNLGLYQIILDAHV